MMPHELPVPKAWGQPKFAIGQNVGFASYDPFLNGVFTVTERFFNVGTCRWEYRLLPRNCDNPNIQACLKCCIFSEKDIKEWGS